MTPTTPTTPTTTTPRSGKKKEISAFALHRLQTAERVKKYSYTSSTHFFIPVMLDWGLFEIREVICMNISQIGHYDYPKAPSVFLMTVSAPRSAALDISPNPWIGSWENLYLTYEEAFSHGPEICAYPIR